MKKPSETQLKILENAAGRTAPYVPRGNSQSGGWSGATATCYREGWLKPPFTLTEEGQAVLQEVFEMSARLREIETILVDGCRTGGLNVFQIKGDWFASLLDPETCAASEVINITKLAEQMVARFP